MRGVEVTIRGEPKEIDALVLTVQERRVGPSEIKVDFDPVAIVKGALKSMYGIHPEAEDSIGENSEEFEAENA